MDKILIDPKERVKLLERENLRLRRALEKAQATTEYVAMMADVELEDDDEEQDVQ